MADNNRWACLKRKARRVEVEPFKVFLVLADLRQAGTCQWISRVSTELVYLLILHQYHSLFPGTIQDLDQHAVSFFSNAEIRTGKIRGHR